MATDAELLALIGRTPSPQTTTTAGAEELPDLDWGLLLSASAQQEIEAATSVQNHLYVTMEQLLNAGPPPVWDPSTTLKAEEPIDTNDLFANFSFSIQEDGSADAIFAPEFEEPPPPPPIKNMASFPLESLWSTKPTEELEDGPGWPSGAPSVSEGGLESIFMNEEAFEAQEALGLISQFPRARASRDVFDLAPRNNNGSDGVVVGRRGADGRFRVTPPPPVISPRPVVTTITAIRQAPPASAPSYVSSAPRRSRGSYVADGDD